MSAQSIGDPTFGLRSQALAILALLSQTEAEFAEWDEEFHRYRVRFNTFAWYNGREKGVAIKVRRELNDPKGEAPPMPVLVVSFGEDRHSNKVFVQIWLTDSIEGAPTVEELDSRVERGTEQRWEFDPYNYGPVVRHIFTEMGRYYAAMGPKFENVIPLQPGALHGFSASNDGTRS